MVIFFSNRKLDLPKTLRFEASGPLTHNFRHATLYLRRSATEAQLGLEFESAWSIEFEFEFYLEFELEFAFEVEFKFPCKCGASRAVL